MPKAKKKKVENHIIKVNKIRIEPFKKVKTLIDKVNNKKEK